VRVFILLAAIFSLTFIGVCGFYGWPYPITSIEQAFYFGVATGICGTAIGQALSN
jgi:hypothetical protein